MNEEQVTSKKPLFTARQILRVLSVLCIVFVFCPSFLVSCSEQSINVNVMTAVGGLSMYDEKVVDAHPAMLICLLIPIAVLVLLFLKKFSDNKTAGIIAVCGVVDIVVWIVFKNTVKKLAEEYYCTFEKTGWYVFNMIALILIVVLSILVVLNIIGMDSDLTERVTNRDIQEKLDKVADAATQMASQASAAASAVASNIANKQKPKDVIGYCMKCGGGIEYGVKFCTSCGNPVPESMLLAAEEKLKAQAQETGDEAEQNETDSSDQ